MNKVPYLVENIHFSSIVIVFCFYSLLLSLQFVSMKCHICFQVTAASGTLVFQLQRQRIVASGMSCQILENALTTRSQSTCFVPDENCTAMDAH